MVSALKADKGSAATGFSAGIRWIKAHCIVHTFKGEKETGACQ